MPPYRAKVYRVAVLVGGLFVSQLILFGPSLVGRKILLPLDVLGEPKMYLSPAASAAWGPPRDPILTDPIVQMEPDRQFAVAEMRAGRLPLWNPHQYCGQPFLAANQTAVFSPFRLFDYLWPGPWVIAWDELLKALVAGIGAYLFFRISVDVGFLAALIGAWLWPLCGFYIQWAGHPQSAAAAWLPLIFFFTDRALRKPSVPWGAGLAVVTGASIVSGHAATSAQVLLADAFFLCWRLITLHGWRRLGSGHALGGIAAVLGGWIFGALLSAPQSLPTIEYLRTSYRMAARVAGGVETPAVGMTALPELILPDFNGSTRRGQIYIGGSGDIQESASTGYVGLITALVLAPLGLCSRKHRSIYFFALALAVLGMGQVLGLPVLKQLYESFPLNILRENRLVLMTGWGIAIMGVIGLEAINLPNVPRRFWLRIAAVVVLCLSIWFLVRALTFPSELARVLANDSKSWVDQISRSFTAIFLRGFGLCMLAVLAWLGIIGGLSRQRWFVWMIGLVAVAEVLGSDFGVYPQGEPAEYYPRQPILTALAQAPPGRVCAVYCFPADLTETHGLLDVRGYDGATPERLVELLSLTQPALLLDPMKFSVLQGYFPQRLPCPIANMMNLRYMIFAGTPSVGEHPRFVSDGYWVYENPDCLPRVFIPRHVQVVNDSARRLELLGRRDFDPTDIAYVESGGTNLEQAAEGEATISSALPSHITIDYDMRTPGLIVLSDLWDPGWHAKINGLEVPVLRVNHAFRGVMAPPGKGILEYDYTPWGFILGLKLSAAAAAIVLIWIALHLFRIRAAPLDESIDRRQKV